MKVPYNPLSDSIDSMQNYYSKLVKCGLNFHYANGHTKHDEGQKITIDTNYATSMTRVCLVLIPADSAVIDREYGLVCPFCADILDRERKK